MLTSGTFVLEPQFCHKDMQWLGFEALEVETEASTWSPNYFNKLQSLPLITDKDDIDQFYRNGDEQNRFRENALVDGGNIIISSIRFIKAKAAQSQHARVAYGPKPMVLF